MTRAADRAPMGPLRFEPLYEYRLWGGRELAAVLDGPLPAAGPVGEAWVLSDRQGHASRVAGGPFAGQTLGQLMADWPEPLLGTQARTFRRFPLLLKFLDARRMLSVQVHPSDAHTRLLPAGETGKTEAWIVLKTGPASRIYAGLKPGTTPTTLRKGLADGRLTDSLAHFTPEVGDCVLLPAGTVHSLGGDLVVFEIQQNSDVTFRLYDWNHVDAKTGRPRPLQVENALACADFTAGTIGPVTPLVDVTAPARETVFRCKQFSCWRVRSQLPFRVGAVGVARVLVCIEGAGRIEHDGAFYPARRGDVLLLPAAMGACEFRPTRAVTLLEIGLPESDVPQFSADRHRR